MSNMQIKIAKQNITLTTYSRHHQTTLFIENIIMHVSYIKIMHHLSIFHHWKSVNHANQTSKAKYHTYSLAKTSSNNIVHWEYYHECLLHQINAPPINISSLKECQACKSNKQSKISHLQPIQDIIKQHCSLRISSCMSPTSK